MPDIEKVIKALEHFKYNYQQYCDCSAIDDALELLKQQIKKTKVVFGRTKDGEFVTECGNCGTYLGKAYSNCPKCNKELDWNSNQT